TSRPVSSEPVRRSLRLCLRKSPAALLPLELVELILRMLFTHPPAFLGSLEGVLALRKIEVASFQAAIATCRWWRNVALQCPTIWGLAIDIDNNSMEWVEKALTLSGSHPLLIISYPREAVDWDQNARFRHVTIRLKQGFGPTSPFAMALQRSAPFLHTFSLEIDWERLIDIGSSTAPRVVLPSPLFNSVTPMLSHLSPPYETHYHELRAFFNLISTMGLLMTLRHLPLLESLTLHVMKYPVSLPRLSGANLSGRAMGVRNVISNLTIPSSCYLEVERAPEAALLYWCINFEARSKVFKFSVPHRLLCTLHAANTPPSPSDIVLPIMISLSRTALSRRVKTLWLNLCVFEQILNCAQVLSFFLSSLVELEVLQVTSITVLPLLSFLKRPTARINHPGQIEYLDIIHLPSLKIFVMTEPVTQATATHLESYRLWRQARNKDIDIVLVQPQPQAMFMGNESGNSLIRS
ncbi:hypothetical protein BDZ97DRAFT_1784379, partial [Flammula alnicola]